MNNQSIVCRPFNIIFPPEILTEIVKFLPGEEIDKLKILNKWFKNQLNSSLNKIKYLLDNIWKLKLNEKINCNRDYSQYDFHFRWKENYMFCTRYSISKFNDLIVAYNKSVKHKIELKNSDETVNKRVYIYLDNIRLSINVENYLFFIFQNENPIEIKALHRTPAHSMKWQILSHSESRTCTVKSLEALTKEEIQYFRQLKALI